MYETLRRRLDRDRGDVAFVDLVDPRQQVDAEDDGQQQRGDQADGHCQSNPAGEDCPRRRWSSGRMHEAQARVQW